MKKINVGSDSTRGHVGESADKAEETASGRVLVMVDGRGTEENRNVRGQTRNL